MEEENKLYELAEQVLDWNKKLNYMVEYYAKRYYIPETKLRRNRNSEIFCQECEHIIPVSTTKVIKMEYCPYCGSRIKEFKFDN